MQVTVGRSHWNCYINGCDLNVRICTKHCVFRVNGGSAAEKSWLACATVAGVPLCRGILLGLAVELRVPGDFFLFC